MNILVTGGAGFIGFHLCKKLLENNENIIIIDNFNDYYDIKLKRDRIFELKKFGNFKIYEIDISEFNNLKNVFSENKIDKICHLAAQAGVRYSIENPFVYEHTNNLGTLNLLELCKKFNIKNFIYASSSSVYGGNDSEIFSEIDNVDKPISLYAATKKTNELYAYTYHHLYNINCTGLRFFTAYGPWGRPDMAYFKFTKNILEKKEIEIYNNGEMMRDFTYIDDIVLGIINALEKCYPYEIFNLGNNNPIKLLNFVEIIEKCLDKKSIQKMMPLQDGDVIKTCANIDKAKKMLDFNPKIDMNTGIKNFINWYIKYYNVK
ncbi:MAG: NAD-dependent epimerase/dehydratase family protein [Patescibacteria group bacterium]|nr:NAD-dependent epimerase/dehydratase family protein [Patescibacteria group bacterium]MDD4304265.1 NAD-dependent epimerase/dehydratase family protein [Patescibacteria group bacterium]MDD4695319.1 NAD-dependent epimerase/dehydratase family protein [Patescibacteria group bacterium]